MTAVPANSAITVGPRRREPLADPDSVVRPGVNVTQNAASAVPDIPGRRLI